MAYNDQPIIHPLLTASILSLIYIKTMYDFNNEDIGIDLNYINGYFMILYDTFKISTIYNTFTLFDDNNNDKDLKSYFDKLKKKLVFLVLVILLICIIISLLLLGFNIFTLCIIPCLIINILTLSVMGIKQGIAHLCNKLDRQTCASFQMMLKFFIHLNYHILTFYLVIFFCSLLLSKEKKPIIDLASEYAVIYTIRIKEIICLYFMTILIHIMRTDNEMSPSTLHAVTCLNLLVNMMNYNN